MVLPIPRYIYVGIKTNENGKQLTIRDSFYSKDIIGDKKHKRSDVVVVSAKQTENISFILKNNFNDNKEIIDKLYVQPISEYPSSCGLNSSGAFSVALTLGIMYKLKKIEQKTIDDWAKSNVSRIIKTKEFLTLFKCSWEIENIFHSDENGVVGGSGVGAFSSIVGSPQGVPLFYFRLDSGTELNLKQFTEQHKIFGFRLDEVICSKDLHSLQDFLWKKNSFLLFCAGKRSPTYSIYPKAVKDYEEMWQSIGNVAKELCGPLIDKNWQNSSSIKSEREDKERIPLLFKMIKEPKITSDNIVEHYWKTIGAICIHGTISLLDKEKRNIRNITNIIKFNQSFLSPLGLLTEDMEEICNHIYDRNPRKPIGIKITGTGKGGDLFIIGDIKTIKNIHDAIKTGKIFEETRLCKCNERCDYRKDDVIHFYSDPDEEPENCAEARIVWPNSLEDNASKTRLIDPGHSENDTKVTKTNMFQHKPKEHITL